jgi:diguanylate cyclase (GGDEF)-like protein
MDELAKEHAKAKRQGSAYSIIFCDVDHFKKYNDRNGHPAGDGVLKQVAAILKKTVREQIDLAARYGGEEFVVMCGNTEANAAVALAERIRAAIAAATFPHGQHQPLGRVSVSVGVATYPAQGKTFSQILQAADAALYQSKAAGRDRVSIASGLEKSAGEKKVS